MGFLKIKTTINPDTNKQLEFVDRNAVVCALILNSEKTKGLFVKQFRVGAMAKTIETVAGMVEDNQSPFEALVAEVRQEVGITESWFQTVIDYGKFYSSVGWTNEVAHLYTVILKPDFNDNFLPQMLDEGESLTYEWIPLDKVYAENATIPVQTALLLAYN